VSATEPPTPKKTTRLAWLWLGIAEWFGSGRLPKAPGTFGSAAALPLALYLGSLSLAEYAATTFALLALGTVAADRASHILGDKDPQSVVIDEVIGVLLAHAFVRTGPLWAQALAWLLFRFFDIKKPGPIYRVQFWKPNGVGIMADDVLAGIVAGASALGATELVRAFTAGLA
jgi:phosphatidylglycerophosphatase A